MVFGLGKKNENATKEAAASGAGGFGIQSTTGGPGLQPHPPPNEYGALDGDGQVSHEATTGKPGAPAYPAPQKDGEISHEATTGPPGLPPHPDPDPITAAPVTSGSIDGSQPVSAPSQQQPQSQPVGGSFGAAPENTVHTSATRGNISGAAHPPPTTTTAPVVGGAMDRPQPVAPAADGNGQKEAGGGGPVVADPTKSGVQTVTAEDGTPVKVRIPKSGPAEKHARRASRSAKFQSIFASLFHSKRLETQAQTTAQLAEQEQFVAAELRAAEEYERRAAALRKEADEEERKAKAARRRAKDPEAWKAAAPKQGDHKYGT